MGGALTVSATESARPDEPYGGRTLGCGTTCSARLTTTLMRHVQEGQK
jgi:hypothetical protein